MPLRQLSPDEVVKLGQQMQLTKLFPAVQQLVAQFYDTAKVQSVTIMATSDYNDEDWDQGCDLQVFDAEGHELTLDFRKPFFGLHEVDERQIEGYLETHSLYSLDDVGDVIREAIADALDIDLNKNGQKCELDVFDTTFVLAAPPQMPKVYIEEEDHAPVIP